MSSPSLQQGVVKQPMNFPFPLKIVNVLGAVLFSVFAYVQYNDIDPEIYYHASSLDAALWLAFYAFIAVLFLLILFKRIPQWLLILGALACLAELIRTGPGLWENVFGEKAFTMVDTSMSADDPRVELTREFFGAFIALAGVVVLWWERVRFAKPRRVDPSTQATAKAD